MLPGPGAFMVIALIAAVPIALTVPSRRKRTAALAAQWQAFQQHCSSGQGQLLQVTRGYQDGRRGSKAVVTVRYRAAAGRLVGPGTFPRARTCS